jgi:hypothetical protein
MPLPLAVDVDVGVGQDPVEPGVEVGVLPQRAESGVSRQHGVLPQILCVGAILRHAHCPAVERRAAGKRRVRSMRSARRRGIGDRQAVRSQQTSGSRIDYTPTPRWGCDRRGGARSSGADTGCRRRPTSRRRSSPAPPQAAPALARVTTNRQPSSHPFPGHYIGHQCSR